MSSLKGLQPARVFHYFEEICKIPHASYNTKAISDYLAAFAHEHNLKYYRDVQDNVVIYKNSAAGYENAPAVIIQGHSDMVAEKDMDCSHDFSVDPLNLVVDGDELKAQGTTLGGDDGIAVAYALAILEDASLKHPALEVVITTNEEVGLLGATALDTTVLSGTRMINIDSEEEGSLLAGCAGGLTARSRIPVNYVEATGSCYQITISGLTGGHSGTEIHKNRANSNILMGRLLHTIGEQMKYMLAELEGGQKDNVITQSTRALVLISEDSKGHLAKICTDFENCIRNEYSGIDEGICVTLLSKGVCTEPALHPVSREKTVFFLMNIPSGVQKMSGSISGLVETSFNPGVLKLDHEALHVSGGVRSSIESAKMALSEKICYLTEFLGGDYEIAGVYPAWEYQDQSSLRDIMTSIYEEMFRKKMAVDIIHAGLECGIFYHKIPGLDCVSFGPEMADIHTTKERLSVSSTKRMWEYLVKVLESLK